MPITFIAGSGDNGAPGGYPAYSPDVLAVGATNLFINGGGSYQGETGWSNPGIISAAENGNTVTITTTTTAFFPINSTVTISGVGASGYDGNNFTVTSSSGNTFTYTDPNNNLPPSSGGQATGSNNGGSGGGPSSVEGQPAYQAGVVPASMSTVGGSAR